MGNQPNHSSIVAELEKTVDGRVKRLLIKRTKAFVNEQGLNLNSTAVLADNVC